MKTEVGKISIINYYGMLFAYVGAGVISGIVTFGFAEIVNILDRSKSIANKTRLEVEGLKNCIRKKKVLNHSGFSNRGENNK